MSNMVFGEIDWNSADSGSGGERASDFMKLSEGENTVRIMGNPVQFYIHWLETSSGKRKVNSPFEDAELVRRLEDSGFKRQARWLIKVLDRRDNNFKLLDVGPQIYNGIKALYNNARWGKVTQYDITIVKAPKGTQPLYGVTPNPKEAIPADLKDKFVAFNERVNLEKIIAPTESRSIYEMMGWKQATAAAGKPASSASQSKASDSDFDFDFE